MTPHSSLARHLYAMSFCCLIVLCYLSRAHAAETSVIKPIVLSNGVRLILAPDPTAATVAITVFVRTARDIGLRSKSLGEMVSHAIWYGSTERTDEWTAQVVDQVGGVLETLQTPDYVALSCVTTSAHVEQAAGIFCEALKHADFTRDALARARRDIMTERTRRLQDGFAACEDRIRSALAGNMPPDEVQLAAVTQAQAQDYFRSRFVPEQTVIAVAGGFSPAEVQTDFEAHLFEFNRHARVPPDLSGPGVPPTHVPGIAPISIAGDAAYALIGVAAPRVDSPDYPAFMVLKSLLGSGHASRLFRRLRDQLGLGYRVGASWRSDLSAPLIGYLEWDANRTTEGTSNRSLKPDEALQRLNTQFDDVLADPPGDAEFARARGMAIGQNALRHERTRDRAFLLGWYEAMGVGVEFDARLPDLLRHVTRDDVLRVAKTYLSPRVSALALPFNL